MALINQVIDFSDDAGRALLKDIGSKAPEFVKTASVINPEKLESEQFALVMRTKEAHVLRKFPIVDKANTWLSCEYFQKTAEQLPFVAQKIAATNLRRACMVYGLEVPETIEKTSSATVTSNRYDEVLSRREERESQPKPIMEKTASDGSSNFYALGDRYAMPNAEFVKKAAAYFQEFEREFDSPEDRHTFAAHVLARAKELGVELDGGRLRKYASSSYGDSVKQHLKIRAEYAIHDPKFAEAYTKLASKMGEVDPETFAKALYSLDKQAGLNKHYDRKLADAFSATFGNSFEKQAGYSWEDSASGYQINGSELKKVAENKYDKVKGIFGPSVADQLKKHAAEIFDSLPTDAKITIVRIAKGEM